MVQPPCARVCCLSNITHWHEVKVCRGLWIGTTAVFFWFSTEADNLIYNWAFFTWVSKNNWLLINYATRLPLETCTTFSSNWKTKSYSEYSIARVFPRFASVLISSLWLALCIVYVLCDWLEWLLWFSFCDTQLKTVLTALLCCSRLTA